MIPIRHALFSSSIAALLGLGACSSTTPMSTPAKPMTPSSPTAPNTANTGTKPTTPGTPMTPTTLNAAAFGARLSGASEVPAVMGAATGMLEAKLTTTGNVLSWKLSYSGLSGPATAAHFHGPAMAGQNAGVVVPITGAMASPVSGTATLTPAQAADLGSGKWYVNVHTAANPNGEIRGQVMLLP
jgi:hypothetical protein